MPYGRHRDGAEPPHVGGIRLCSGLTCRLSGKHRSGCGCADRLSGAGRLSGGSGFKGWEGDYSPVGASWWGVVFCKDKLWGSETGIEVPLSHPAQHSCAVAGSRCGLSGCTQGKHPWKSVFE